MQSIVRAKQVSFAAALFGAAFLFGFTYAVPSQGTSSQIREFTVPKAPSGLFYYDDQDLLYVLCGTATNNDHYLYAYTTDGTQKCFITIPQAVGMTRVDGFFIKGDKAYIADSQGPIYASDAGKLGGSVYEVEWADPCECAENASNDTNFAASCARSTATWSPTLTTKIAIDAASVKSAFPSINEGQDGSQNDVNFRNSGVVVVGTDFFAINGVHPLGQSLQQSYPKSLIKGSLAGVANNAATLSSAWPFTGTELGHHVDMEGLTCGSDACATYIYIGDEYNYVYRLTLAESDPATAVEVEWNVDSLVGPTNDDKGIESLTSSSKTGYFYAGIQGTAKVHVLMLDATSSSGNSSPDASGSSGRRNSAAAAAGILFASVLVLAAMLA
mmetsp:Transcript_40813/g.123234  ORF Transcript_40813/g.123234 Transcript_40813/m.123234 type:complete len:386 (-) Transcript_40813:265-1422(-)